MTRLAEILFNLMALFVAVYLGVDIFYRVVNARLLPMKSPVTETVAVTSPTKEKQPSRALYERISRRGLLGGPVVEQKEEGEEMGEEQIAALTPTRLNILLLGTVSGPERIAFAVMEEKGEEKAGPLSDRR